MGVGVFLILYALYRLDLIELKTLITLTVVEMFAAVLSYHFGRWRKDTDKEAEQKREAETEERRIKREEENKQKEKLEQEHNKRREKLKGYIYEHNQMLIQSVIKDWYGKQKPLSLVDQQKKNEHLQTGYPKVWKLWFEECEILKHQISEDEKIIKEYIKNKSYSKLEHIFDDKYFFETEDGIISLGTEAELIYGLLNEFVIKGQVPEKYKIENSKEIIETIVNDKPLYEMFEKVRENKKNLNKKINDFKIYLKKIVYDFEKRHIELKGTCIDCKDWHEELESLK